MSEDAHSQKRSRNYRLWKWELSTFLPKELPWLTSPLADLARKRLTLKWSPQSITEVKEKKRTTVMECLTCTISMNSPSHPLNGHCSPFHCREGVQNNEVPLSLNSQVLLWTLFGLRLVSPLNLVHHPAKWAWPAVGFWQVPKVSSFKWLQDAKVVGHSLLWVIHSLRYQNWAQQMSTQNSR